MIEEFLKKELKENYEVLGWLNSRCEELENESGVDEELAEAFEFCKSLPAKYRDSIVINYKGVNHTFATLRKVVIEEDEKRLLEMIKTKGKIAKVEAYYNFLREMSQGVVEVGDSLIVKC